MAALLKVITEGLSIVESILGLLIPFLYDDYDNWTQSPASSWSLITGRCTLTSGTSDEDEHEAYISKQFTLVHKAHGSALTVRGRRTAYYLAPPGCTEAEVLLVKPDTSVISLYQGEDPCSEQDYLNAADITAHLNQSGRYTLRLRAKVRSYFVEPSTYYVSTSYFDNLLLIVNEVLPGQPTALSGHAESDSEVHLMWTGGIETDSYVVYYKKTTDSEWSYVTELYNQWKIVGYLESGIMYDFKVVGVNGSGEGPASETIQLRPFGTFTQTLTETATPTESFAKNRVRSMTFSEVLVTAEVFNVQKISVAPVSTVILLCGYTGNKVYTFESGLVAGYYDTPEINFGYPDKDKTLVEIRFGSEALVPHTVVVYVSIDSGTTWLLLGSDTIGLGMIGYVYPWLTSNRFLLRFSGTGLHLYFYEVYAIPSGWKVKV